MCFQEFIGYACGHCSMAVLRPCPLTTSEHKNPVCDLQPNRPFLVDAMCPVCSRLMHSRAVLIQEWEHHFLHERGACGCEVIFPDLVRPRVIGGASVFQNMAQGAGGGGGNGAHQQQQPATAAASAESKKAPPMFERVVGPNGQEAYSVRLSSLFAAEWVDDHAELHRKGECNCNADFNRYKPEWVQGASVPQHHCLKWQHAHRIACQPSGYVNTGGAPQMSLTQQTDVQQQDVQQQDVQAHAQAQVDDHSEQENEEQVQVEQEVQEVQEVQEAQDEESDEEQPRIHYATPVCPSRRPNRRSLSADITRSITATCLDEDYEELNSSSPAGGSSASEAGEPHLYHVRRRQRRASSIDMPLNSSSSSEHSHGGSPTDGDAAGNKKKTDVGAQNIVKQHDKAGKTAAATTTGAAAAPAVSPRRRVTFSDTVQCVAAVDAATSVQDNMPELPAPPTTLPGPDSNHQYLPGPKGDTCWGPSIFPSSRDDVFRASAAAAAAVADPQQNQPQQQQQGQLQPQASCSRGLQVDNVNALTTLPPLHYARGAVAIGADGAPAIQTGKLGSRPRCKPIAGLPIGAGPEGTHRHMPAFSECALKKSTPPGARTRLYD
ncbi:hypothetical protein RB594_009373 [Gaeumannomyces avenae]